MALLGPINDDGGQPKEVRRATAEARRHAATRSSTVTEVHDDALIPTTPRDAAAGQLQLAFSLPWVGATQQRR
jgi:hypothetical protein